MGFTKAAKEHARPTEKDVRPDFTEKTLARLMGFRYNSVLLDLWLSNKIALSGMVL